MKVNKKIIVNVDPKEHSEIKRLAKTERRTISSLTRKALVDFILQIKKEKKIRKERKIDDY